MSGIFKIKNAIRNFCRKEDELITPIFRFIFSYALFLTIQKLFGYNDLAGKKEVIFLLSVLASLLPDSFLFFMSGVVISLHCFSVSLETGAVFVIIFILMYCFYMRFFPRYAYVILMVPIFYLLGIPYAAPIIVAMTAGLLGFIPAAFGVVIYYFSLSVAEVSRMLAVTDSSMAEELAAFKHLIVSMISNKEMYTSAAIFAITVVITGILAKFTYDYAIYIAIAGGTVINIFGSIFAGYIMNQDVPMNQVVIGSIIGLIFAIVVRFGKGILDYKRTERVQFEDDEYYYYVKAVPKIDAEKKNPRTKQGQIEKALLEGREYSKKKHKNTVTEDDEEMSDAPQEQSEPAPRTSQKSAEKQVETPRQAETPQQVQTPLSPNGPVGHARNVVSVLNPNEDSAFTDIDNK